MGGASPSSWPYFRAGAPKLEEEPASLVPFCGGGTIARTFKFTD